MLERDYIMRLIRQFFEALEKLKEEKAEKTIINSSAGNP